MSNSLLTIVGSNTPARRIVLCQCFNKKILIIDIIIYYAIGGSWFQIFVRRQALRWKVKLLPRVCSFLPNLQRILEIAHPIFALILILLKKIDLPLGSFSNIKHCTE